MKSRYFKHTHVFFYSLFLIVLHLPFVFAKAKPTISKESNTVSVNVDNGNTANISQTYERLRLASAGLSEQAFGYAMKGFDFLKHKGKIGNDNIVSIADFTKPSSEKRLFVIDLKNYRILFNTYVAHGHNSGKEYATSFSNTPESNQSSLGFYVTSDTYTGKNGYSLHLTGLENGINDKADERAIVMHGAPYVSESFIRSQGCCGRSWGCPAVSEQMSKPIIEKIKNGTCLFIYSANKNYLSHSKILNS